MENIKLYAMNELQRQKAQERAFSFGLTSNKEGVFLECLFLYFYFDDKCMKIGADYGYFKGHENKELTFEQWMSYEPEKEEMTDSEILGKVWKIKGGEFYYTITAYLKEKSRFKINGAVYTKQELLENWKHAESLQSVAVAIDKNP